MTVSRHFQKHMYLRNAYRYIAIIICFITVLAAFSGCGPTKRDLAAIDYNPGDGTDWETSTPGEQGLDPELIARLYYNAESVETITSLLVIKNGKLIAEKYFHGNKIDSVNRLQSVTKSFTSALAGIAIDNGYLSVDQKMMSFFPELTGSIVDIRKYDITVEQLLQMRAGYPWEESTEELFKMLYTGFRPSLLADVPLVYDPGTGMWYSNLTSHILGIIVARAAGRDLMTFAQETLFGPLGISPDEWIQDWEGNYNGHADLFMTARDMVKFGQLYLDNGEYNGEQIISSEWVHDSLQVYSEDAWAYRIGKNVSKMAYGYQWWSAEAGGYRYFFAWGHGGQQIALVPSLDMVIVVTADPLFGEHGDRSWKFEKQNLNLVGDFIATLPIDE